MVKKEERQKLDEDGHRARDQTEYKVSGSFARTKGDEGFPLIYKSLVCFDFSADLLFWGQLIWLDLSVICKSCADLF
ncbi:hypothetical protein V6Z11_A13G192500 [Gossypium hirsutum]